MNSPHKANALDTYLDRLTRQLRLLPEKLRSEYRQEIGLHLQSLADARVARGETPEAAMNAAIKSFGDPKKVGREIASEIGWANGLVPGSLLSATACGLVWLVLLTYSNSFLFSIMFQWHMNNTVSVENQTTMIQMVQFAMKLHDLMIYLVVPCFAGWITGSVSPKAAPKGMAAAAGLFLTIAWVAYYRSLSAMADQAHYFFILAFDWGILGYLSASISSLRLRGLRLGVWGNKPRLGGTS